MVQITDEMIEKSLHNAARGGLIFGIIFLTIGAWFLLTIIKKAKNKENVERREDKKNNKRSLLLIVLWMLSFSCIGSGIAGISVSLENYRAEKKGYDVYIETVQSKLVEYKKNGRRHKRTVHYFILSNLGKRKVSKSTYRKYTEGDTVIVVLSNDDKIIRMYDPSKYEYVGTH